MSESSAESGAKRPDFIVFDNAGKLKFWPQSQSSPNWSQACEMGRKRAQEIIEYLRADPDRADVLRATVAEIVRMGEFGAVETGFFAEIADRLATSRV